MKTFAVFLAVCVGFSFAALKLPLGLNTVSNAIGLDISDIAGVRALFNQAGSEAAQENILGAAATAFLAKFKNGVFLADKSAADIMTDFRNNVKELFGQPADPMWTQTLMNEVMGLSKLEFQSLLGTRTTNRSESSGSNNIGSSNRRRRQATTLPKSVDWRTKGAISPVKNQGKCGSCWAFAAVGTLEGRIGVKTGNPPVLSEQNLIDCAKNVNGSECCQGCEGGWITDGYTQVQLKGINSNDSYPYEAKDGECRYNAAIKAADTVGFKYTEQDDEKDLMRAVAEGPVAVAVDANGWSSYSTGIYRCRLPLVGKLSPLKINHGVVVVGYGTSFLTDFWIVKNSWGSNWGENGYIRIARNADNQCGIASQANYPLI